MRLAGLRHTGVVGGIKTAYHSWKHTSSPTSLQFHSNVIVDIDATTQFDINGKLAIGTNPTPASHPELGQSKFSTAPGSTVRHTGDSKGFVGPCSVVHIEGEFSIGDSGINCHSRIMCADEITIGDGTTISWNFEVLDDDRHTLYRDGEQTSQSASVEIEDDVWIGHDVSVGKGVTIGEGSVIGNDSVVVSDIPPNSLAVGCPAEVVERGVEWE